MVDDVGFPFRPLPLVTARLVAAGVDAIALLRTQGLPEDADRRPEEPWPLRAVTSFVTEAARRLGDPLLGLSIAQALPAGTYAIVEFCARSAPTLRKGYETLVAYMKVVDASAELAFDVDDEGCGTLRFRVIGEQAPCAVFHEAAIGFLLRMAREAVPGFMPLEVSFRHTHPAEVTARAAALLACPVKFGASMSALRTSPADLARPLRSADQPLHAFLLAQAASLRAQNPNSVAERVRAAVGERLGNVPVDIKSVAQALALSPRTLQRRLEAEGPRGRGSRMAANPRTAVGPYRRRRTRVAAAGAAPRGMRLRLPATTELRSA